MFWLILITIIATAAGGLAGGLTALYILSLDPNAMR